MTVRSAQRVGFEPDVTFESNDYHVLQSLVAAGMGVTLLPDLALVAPNPGVRVIEVLSRATGPQGLGGDADGRVAEPGDGGDARRARAGQRRVRPETAGRPRC